MTEPLLEVSGLKKHFPIHKGVFSRVSGHVYAVDGVSFDVARGETLRHLDPGAVPAARQTALQALLRGDSAALQSALGTATDAWAEVLRAANHTQNGRSAEATTTSVWTHSSPSETRSQPRSGKRDHKDHGEMKERCFKCHGAVPRLAAMPQCGEASVPQI